MDCTIRLDKGEQAGGQFYKQASKQRLEYIDVFRSLGIIVMVMGHIGFGGEFDHFIHAFHMPMFFFTSGFFYKRRDCSIGEFVGKKVKSLLIPYIFFGIAHYFASLILDGFSIKPLIYLFTFNTISLPIAGALWFLTALFFTDIFYFLLDRWNVKLLIIPLVLVGSFIDQMLPYPLPWALSASFIGLGLYWFGEMSKKNEVKIEKLLNMNWWQILVVGVITTILIFINGYINMREGTYAFMPLFWINALLSIYVGVSISKLICRTGNIKWLTSIGRNSIVYVCLNQLVIRVLYKAFGYIQMPIVITHLLMLVFSMIILYWLAELFTRTKLKVFIGK